MHDSPHLLEDRILLPSNVPPKGRDQSTELRGKGGARFCTILRAGRARLSAWVHHRSYRSENRFSVEALSSPDRQYANRRRRRACILRWRSPRSCPLRDCQSHSVVGGTESPTGPCPHKQEVLAPAR